MRILTLLALATLVALPLSAHEGWREPRRAPHPGREAHSRHERWEPRGWYYRPGWDTCGERVLLRPLPRPLDPSCGARVELRFR